MAQEVYVTMLLSDGYLQGTNYIYTLHLIWFGLLLCIGAQVLAASLRDGGTTKRLAVIVPEDEVHRLLPETITQLEVLL
jgi:hypothetical protein